MEIKDLPTCSCGAYPEVIIDEPDKQEACVLQNLFGAGNSETSAVLGYIYQHYAVSVKEPEIADIFKKIAMCEMRHHDILGTIIARLGGTPYYMNSKCEIFDMRSVKPTKNIKEILINNIKDENDAIKDYECAKTKINNHTIIEVLNRIIADEQIHAKTLEALLDYVCFYR